MTAVQEFANYCTALPFSPQSKMIYLIFYSLDLHCPLLSPRTRVHLQKELISDLKRFVKEVRHVIE
jgi:hypothetical protein